MKNTIRNIFHSPKFVIGFIIFFGLLLFTFVYPWVVTADPMEMIGQGNFFKPGTYISVKDTVESKNYTLNIEAKSSFFSLFCFFISAASFCSCLFESVFFSATVPSSAAARSFVF